MKRLPSSSLPALQQYAIATVVALGLLTYQIWQGAVQWGLDAMHPRIQVMREQIISALVQHPSALAEVIFHLAALFATHLALCLGSIFVYRQAVALHHPGWRNRVAPATVFLLISTLTAILWNRLLYPYSTALRDAELLLIQPTTPILLWGGTGVVALAAAAAALSIAVQTPRRAAFALLTLSIAVLWSRGEATLPPPGKTLHKYPDIIIIGIDSLRPDVLKQYGFGGRKFMPTVESTLATSVVFEDAVTPLARTFVSYMSLLTGDNPVSHGARFNLHPRKLIRRDTTLAHVLREKDYYSLMSIDESRFANFDRSYGFNEVISPPPGALDFLLGNAFDSVATNLFMALPSFEKIFPYSRANRAAYNIYQPAAQVNRLLNAIDSVPTAQPLFLVSHLCLPHWPYLPENILEPDNGAFSINQAGFEGVPEKYPRALARADEQVQALMAALQQSGRLDNAVLVIMSDHGEGFATSRDTRADLAPFLLRDHPAPPFGHGSAALSRAQNHVVLGMQRYIDGKPLWSPRVIKGPASLIDVAPTLAEAIGMPTDSFDGRSMLDVLDSNRNILTEQFRFLENGIRSTGVEQQAIDEKAVVLEMAYLYQIRPDLRFEIRPALARKKLREKQRGVLWRQWGLAATPDPTGTGTGCWVLIDYENNETSCVEYPASRTTMRRMQDAVCRHYRGDPGFIDYWCVAMNSKHRQTQLE